jgi:hypothetical protein
VVRSRSAPLPHQSLPRGHHHRTALTVAPMGMRFKS